MSLTAKQEKFCQEIVKGKTQYESYCIAYPEQVDTSKRETLDNNAYMLSKKSEIIARIDELRKPAIDKVNITLEKLITELEEVKKLAKNKEQLKVFIKAIEEQGKLSGLYTIKTENLNKNVDFEIDYSEDND